MTTMTRTPSPAPPEPDDAGLDLERHSPIPAWVGVALCFLLASAQIALGGYQLGVGNQSIQIAFLKHWAQPGLYSSDPMVTQTMPLYPSYFFRALAPLLSVMSLEHLYLTCQILTSCGALAAVYWLARSIFRSHATALAAVGVLVAGHLHALAGDALYSPGFTHTFAALPLAVAALALAFRGKWPWAFVVAGLLFNIHALTAAYTLLMLGAAMLADLRQQRFTEWLVRGVLCGSIVLACASPTLALMLAHRQSFDAEWINLTRIRSADHSFPSTWWVAGDSDVPRYVLVLALFVLAWSFAPLRQGSQGDGARRGARMIVLMTLAVLVLFGAGYLFTEIWPIPTIIRLQPFRASRLLMILMLVQIAHAAVAAIRAGAAGRTRTDDGRMLALQMPARVAEIVSGGLILLTLAVPSLVTLLPLTVIVAMAAGLIAGHLSWRQAVVAVGALLVALLAFMQTQFPLPFVSPGLSLLPASSATPEAAGLRALALTILLTAGLMAYLQMLVRRPRARLALVAVTVFAGCFFARVLFVHESAEDGLPEAAALADVSDWARTQTAASALFLTPTGMSNFRISAERSIVDDWRDGTQMYFSANFGPDWLARTQQIEPGLALTQDQSRLLSRGGALESLSDDDLVALADEYQADYILLHAPPPGAPARSLEVAYKGATFIAYKPQTIIAPTPPGVLNVNNWNDAERFMNTTVADNIEKYRKADVTFTVVDASGKPLRSVPIKVDQTQQAFNFGTSLGFFEPNGVSPNGDEKPPPARPVELQKAPELFNASMIPFSGKWQYIEPTKGKYEWSDLDKYVDYATKNHMTLEFHHLSGILPDWVESMGGVGGQTGLSFGHPIPAMQTEFNRHCFDTVARYADRIKYWQVVNEKYMMQYVPPVMKALQQKYPNDQFGLSDCVRFWDGTENGVPVPGGTSRGNGRGSTRMNANSVQWKGADAVDWLIGQGVHPDFFSIHGHWPLGLWSDPRDMYDVIDYFQERKVRVHISEEFLQLGSPVYGPLRTGVWTPQLQGEYLCRWLTVAFSHPDVDMANYWGLAPDGWGASNSGLIDQNGATRPAWDMLKKLFNETWRSHAAGELSLEGSYFARVFHGTYTVILTLPGGKTATASVTVPQKIAADIKLQLAADGTLKALP